MSDQKFETAAARAAARMQQEIAEFDTPRARYQAQLDRMMWERREAAIEEARIKKALDPYGLHLYD